MKNKRGQMKIQQMIFMILAVTIFFVLVGLFILVINFSNLKQKATVLQEDNARLLVSKIADSPEFSCGESFGTGMSSCIDMDKVMALKKSITNYGNGSFWGVTGLEIVKIFPKNSMKECTQSNFPNCGKITLASSNGTGISNFVSLCEFNSTNGGNPFPQCSLGEIIATYQEVQ